MSNHDFPFSLRDICMLENISVPNDGRTTFVTNCPVCGKHTLNFDFQKDVFHCFGAGCEISGGILHFYILCEGKEGMKLSDARKEIESRLFGGTNISEEERKSQRERMEARKKEIESKLVSQCSLRSIEERHETYTALLEMLNLAQDHYEDLRSEKRLLSDETIRMRKYKTYPVGAYGEYPLRLLEKGLYLDGVPGFFKNNGKWELRAMKRGIMIPIISHNGLIQGFQIRKDDSLLKTFYQKDENGNFVLDKNKMKIPIKEKKFTWLSSKNLPDGTATGSYCHYAADFCLNGNNKFVPLLGKDDGIVLTEGPLKGDIFHEITGYPAICVPGVNCYQLLEKELQFLKTLGLKIVYQAYDMDYLTNPNVYLYLKKSYEIIRNLNLGVVRLHWNPNYKGIDDYYIHKKILLNGETR